MASSSGIPSHRKRKSLSKSRYSSIENHSPVISPQDQHELLQSFSRLLETNSFSGKMNALNEVNKLLPNLNSIHRAHDSDGLTAEKFLVSSFSSLHSAKSLLSGLGSRTSNSRYCPTRLFASTSICGEIRTIASIYYQRTSINTAGSC